MTTGGGERHGTAAADADGGSTEAGSGTTEAETITVPFRVRFDEAGPDGLVRASTLLRYAQECAWIHSEALGFDRAWYVERGLTWVVRSIELAVVGRVGSGGSLSVSTAVVGFHRIWARRRATVRGAAGDRVATIDTDWVMTDRARGSPIRVPDEFPRAFRVPPDRYEPTRVALPPAPDGTAARSFEVRPHELDPLEHANHAVYLDWLEEAVLDLPGGPAVLAAVPRTYRLEYAAPAMPDLALVGWAWATRESGGVAYRLEAAGRDLFRGVVLPRPAER